MEDSIGDKCKAVTQRLISGWVGLVIRYYYVVLGLCVITTGVFVGGLSFVNDGGKIESHISPSRSIALDDLDTQEDVFPDMAIAELVYFVSKDDNILTVEAYQEILEFDRLFRTEAEDDGNTYDSLCFRIVPEAPCYVVYHPLAFWEVAPNTYDLSSIRNDQDIIDQINSGVSIAGTAVDTTVMFGDATPEDYENLDGTNSIRKAKGTFYFFLLSGDDDDEDEINDFEDEMEDFFDDFNDDSDYIEAYTLTWYCLKRGAPAMIQANIGVTFVLGIPLMIGVFLLLFTRWGCRSSNFEIGLGSVLIILISLIQGNGIAGYSGMKSSLSSTVASPIVLMFMSLSHTFFIAQAFSERRRLPALDRVKNTYIVIGPPMLAACIIHVLTFAFLSTININRLLNLAAVLSIVFMFQLLNLFTVMPILLYFSAKRQDAGRADLCGACACCSLCCKTEEADLKHSERESIFTRSIARAVYYWPTLIIMTVLLLSFAVINIYYTSVLEYEIEPKWLFLKDSFTEDTFETRDDYFKDFGFGVVITCDDTDLAKREQQLEMIELQQDITECDGCEDDWFVDRTLTSWYQVFQFWISQGACRFGSTVTVNLEADGTVSEEYFIPCVKKFLASDGAPFIPNISWNDEMTKIEAVWISANVIFFDNEDVVDGMNDIRDVIEAGPGDCSMYNPEMLFFDHYLQIKYDLLAQFLPISASIFIFSSLLLSSFYKGVITLSNSFSVVLALFGMVSYGDFTQANAFLGNLIVFAYGASVDNHLYYFGLHNTIYEDDRVLTSLGKFITPVLSRFLVIICGVITFGACPNFYPFAPVITVYAFLNLFNSLIVCTIVMRLSAKYSKKKPDIFTTEGTIPQGLGAAKPVVRDSENYEMTARLKSSEEGSPAS
mmetsp:Transcript_28974/g.51798  ORF Transcript_28974/g.51798 Transcript_28974/m.51798 type:complete len:889 (-) Transcript_28974:23-2689(-)